MKDTEATAALFLFFSFFLFRFLFRPFHRRGWITLLSTNKPRWKTWHSPGATIYSIFAKLAKSLPGKQTNQPDVLSFLASRERKMIEVAYRKRDGKEKKRIYEREKERERERERERNAHYSYKPTSWSYLWHEIARKRVSVRQDDFSFCFLALH